jgi:acylphosphatase
VDAYVLLVSGRVQGVGFRWFTEREALRRGVTGYVRNLPDGRVEVRAQADAAVLTALLARLRVGPRGAQVDDVEMRPTPVDANLTGFEVRF